MKMNGVEEGGLEWMLGYCSLEGVLEGGAIIKAKRPSGIFGVVGKEEDSGVGWKGKGCV